MSYFLEPDSHIRDNVKVVLDLSNYAAKKINDATGIETSNLAAKNDFIALKTEADKLYINELVMFQLVWIN